MAVPGAGLAKGLAVTLRTMTRRSVTAQYPEAQPALPPRTRGVIALLEENCTVCMLCARECPDWCIYIDSHKETVPPAAPGGRERSRNVLDRFAIDFALCMYCGICIEVCPFDALFWSPEFEYAAEDVRDLTHERDRLREWMWTVPVPPPLDPAAEEPKEIAAACKAAEKAAAASRAAAGEAGKGEAAASGADAVRKAAARNARADQASAGQAEAGADQAGADHARAGAGQARTGANHAGAGAGHAGAGAKGAGADHAGAGAGQARAGADQASADQAAADHAGAGAGQAGADHAGAGADPAGAGAGQAGAGAERKRTAESAAAGQPPRDGTQRNTEDGE